MSSTRPVHPDFALSLKFLLFLIYDKVSEVLLNNHLQFLFPPAMGALLHGDDFASYADDLAFIM